MVVVTFAGSAWRAEVAGDGARAAFAARYPALEWAHRWAQSHRPSLVRVFDEAGALEDEWAYGAFAGIRWAATAAARPALGAAR